MKVIMVDVDGVILDNSYRINADLSTLITSLSSAKTRIEIIPNSDTPIERLDGIFKTVLNFSPKTIIGEKGAVIKSKRILGTGIYQIANICGIDDYRNKLSDLFSSIDCDIVVGDSVTLVREKKVFSPNRRMLIIDSLRRQSIGFYLRTTDKNGLPVIDNAWFTEGRKLFEVLAIPDGLEAKDFNEACGVIILNPVDINKTIGFQYVQKLYTECTEFFMIGDSDSDIINSKQVIMCSVGNGSENLKNESSFVSSKPFAQGLLECIDWIKAY